jgi:predicted SAM-dependent methyltransferase
VIRINMGCGWRNFGSGWVHIDAGEYDHLDYKSITDLSQFDDDSVDLIYASHVIEYFDREDILGILKEWNRVLIPGATLRVAVPNFQQIAKLYNDGQHGLNSFVGLRYGKMTMGDQTIYHKTVYDFDSLSEVLEKVGFKKVRFYDWRDTSHALFDDHSQAYLPHMNKENGELMSLNVEATA